VLTRDAAIPVLTAVTCAPITTTVRGIRSEVPVPPEVGLRRTCVINCDNLMTIALSRLDPEPVGTIDLATRARLDLALRYALDIIL
jgi:mRNA interferase MazF